MLNITRRRGERIVVGDNIFVSVLEVSGQTVRLGIDAPRSVRVYREELWLEIKAQNEAAAQAAAIPEGTIPQLPAQPAAPDVKAPPSSESGAAPSPPASQPVNQIKQP
jgi:carbon storage regulator